MKRHIEENRHTLRIIRVASALVLMPSSLITPRPTEKTSQLISYDGDQKIITGIFNQNGVQINARKSSDNTTCFDEQNPSVLLSQAAKSTVMIISMDGFSQGSGVIVANSAFSSQAGNRILTDAHVMGIRTKSNEVYKKPDERVIIISSSGEKLGEAVLKAIGTTDMAESSRHDMAVLEMDPSSFTPQSREAFFNIKGLEIAPSQGTSGLNIGYVKGPAGSDHGMSGGPVVDSQGRIIGLVEAHIESPDDTRVTLNKPRLYDAARHTVTGDPITPRPVSMHIGQNSYFEPVSDLFILKALNKSLTAGPLMQQPAIEFGMAHGSCVVLDVDAHQANLEDVNEFSDQKRHGNGVSIDSDSMIAARQLQEKYIKEPQSRDPKGAITGTTALPTPGIPRRALKVVPVNLSGPVPAEPNSFKVGPANVFSLK